MATGGEQSLRPTIFLTDEDVNSLAEWSSAIEAIRNAYGAESSESRNPGRIFASSEREWMRIMPSIPTTGDYFGYKSITGVAADGMRVTYLISLFEKKNGDLAALLDGNSVTGLRTAATTAVGAQAITTTKPIVVGVIGSGFEARSHITALSEVLTVAEARVFSPTPKNRENFASEMSGALGFPITAVDSAEAATRGVDLLLCAARSVDETPTVRSEWVADNATVISIGSTTPGQRELPEELLGRASIIVADSPEEVFFGSGDLIVARKAGIAVDDVAHSLTEVLRGECAIDTESGIRIYKSTGAGLQDIVVAEMLVHRARELAVGTELSVGIVTTRK